MSWLKRNNIFWILILFVIIIPTLYGVIHKGFFVSDDGNWMVIRFSAFYQSFREGQFPTRFLGRLNNSYGYPVSNFLYPGYLYAGIPLKAVGFNSLDAVKILYGLSILSGGVFIFLWLRKFFNSFSALAGAIIFTYAPYHLYTLYWRGSLGELLSLAILPFVFWSVERRSTFLLSLGFFALLLAHNTLALLFAILLLGYILVRKKVRWALFPLITGGCISAFFTIPALYDLQYTKFASTKISDPTNHFAPLTIIGYISFFLILVTLFSLLLMLLKKREIQFRGISSFFLLCIILSMFLASSVSSVIWTNIPSSWIQFPFRFLAIGVVSASFLAAYGTYHLFPKYRLIVGVGLVILTLFFSLQYIFPKKFELKDIGFYDTNESLTTTHDEYMTKEARNIPTSRAFEKVEVFEGGAVISGLVSDSDRIQFKAIVESNSVIKINTLYFPGWNVSINGGGKIAPFFRDDGLIYIVLPKGEYSIDVAFSETPIRAIADALSLAGLVLLFVPFGRRMIYKFIQ